MHRGHQAVEVYKAKVIQKRLTMDMVIPAIGVAAMLALSAPIVAAAAVQVSVDGGIAWMQDTASAHGGVDATPYPGQSIGLSLGTVLGNRENVSFVVRHSHATISGGSNGGSTAYSGGQQTSTALGGMVSLSLTPESHMPQGRLDCGVLLYNRATARLVHTTLDANNPYRYESTYGQSLALLLGVGLDFPLTKDESRIVLNLNASYVWPVQDLGGTHLESKREFSVRVGLAYRWTD